MFAYASSHTRRVSVRLPLAALIAATLLSACGGGDEEATTPEPGEESTDAVTGDANADDVEVIDEWAKVLTKGDTEAAAEFFALPSTVENGPTLRLQTAADARLFNASLPCGAELTAAQSEGEFTTATFELTERPGPGVCGDGTGNEAQTTFVIEDGKIVEWRRVANGLGEPAPGEAV